MVVFTLPIFCKRKYLFFPQIYRVLEQSLEPSSSRAFPKRRTSTLKLCTLGMPNRKFVAHRQGPGFLLWKNHTHHCTVSNTVSRGSANLSLVDQLLMQWVKCGVHQSQRFFFFLEPQGTSSQNLPQELLILNKPQKCLHITFEYHEVFSEVEACATLLQSWVYVLLLAYIRTLLSLIF